MDNGYLPKGNGQKILQQMEVEVVLTDDPVKIYNKYAVETSNGIFKTWDHEILTGDSDPEKDTDRYLQNYVKKKL